MPPETPPLPAMFTCERQRARLSVPGCIRMWKSAQAERPAPWQGTHHCLTCPIGAAHAGQKPEEAVHKRAEEAVRLFCPRCQRQAMRLIHGLSCISCFNRQREMIRGKNAKGNPPIVIMARIHSVALATSTGADTGAAAITTTPDVMSAPEAMLVAVNRALKSGQPFAPMRFGQANRAWAPIPFITASADQPEAA